MGVFIEPVDLDPFATIDSAKAEAMIEDAEAMAIEAAPCITEPSFAKQAAVKAILRAAILRWNDSGSGARTSMSGLGYAQTIDTTNPRKSLFWPSEIEALQKLCKTSDSGGAFNIDTVPGCGPIVHADICAINFGAQYCSCGAVLTQGLPLYEQ
ncbi:hypothetical protein IU454_08010 [Nocardia farcinica]|uniref:hypothetical protein n=1 Tax=Nocardia farcinica TaxID=37329 RepID=UPI0018956C0A|nr:hypothetical protein [Nocardia farcinica]MBF6291807.1 hypothetical protein [Nocardia farcinica]